VVDKAPATPGATRRSRSKSTKKVSKLTPLEERLKETEIYTRPRLEEFYKCKNVQERLLLVHSLLSDDVTDVSRVWPLQLKTKDSRRRRELSQQGKDCFIKDNNSAVLQYYNEALMYSSGKGIAHTLAMRAAFFLATDDHALAVRDLSIALEYGCLETELLDFLLVHHTEDEVEAQKKSEDQMDTAIETMRNAKFDMKDASAEDISQWADNIRDNLSKALKLKRTTPGSKKIKDDILKNIIENIRQASEGSNLDDNLEIEELEVPKLKEKNPLCPAYSEAARIASDPDKGRKVLARRDIKAGEMICVDDPVCSMLCPDDKTAITSHCINCFRFTRAPLPCDTCCSVVFCSKKCKVHANLTFHKYECQLKLYEMFEYEKQEVFGLFMALRAITQKPVQYFTENQKEIEKFLELDEPKFPFPGRAYTSTDYRALANLMTHINDLDEEVRIKNCVLSVFFLRFLKTAGYFGIQQTQQLRGGASKPPGNVEMFILRMIHQIICAQVYNAQPIHKITKTFQWEKVGTALNPSLALINHSCDSNALRCSVNKSSILVAARHIPEGEEITESYTVHFRDSDLNTRQYHTLKNYMFACECEACKGNWPMEDEVPDELHAIPSFEQERVYKVGFGDKKACVREINLARKEVERCMGQKRFNEALIAYQALCKPLEEHIRKPHIYFLQARSGITHSVWNLYCTQFPEKPLDEYDDTNRDHAKEIYKNNLTEALPTEYEVEIPTEIEVESNGYDVNNDKDKAALVEATRLLLEKSSEKVADAKSGTEAIKTAALDARQASLAMEDNIRNTTVENNQNGGHVDVISNGNVKNNLETEADKAEAEKLLKRQKERELAEKEQQVRMSRRKQWEEEENQRKNRELERKKKREKETEEKIRKANEKEKLAREIKKAEEEEKRRQREIEYEQRQKKEQERQEKIAMEKMMKKKEEEDELALLLSEIGDSFEPSESDLMQLEAEQGKPPFKIERDIMSSSSSSAQHNNTSQHTKSHKLTNGNSENVGVSQSGIMTHSPTPLGNGTQPMTGTVINNDKETLLHGQGDARTNFLNGVTNSGDVNVPEVNVWSALRKIKESKFSFSNLNPEGEKVSLEDFDKLINDLPAIVEKEANTNKKLPEVIEEDENDANEKAITTDKGKLVTDGDMNESKSKKQIKEFNYEQWRSEYDHIFGGDVDFNSVTIEKSASEDLYLQNLKNKIALSIEKQTKEMKKNEKQKVLQEKNVNSSQDSPTMPKKGDDFAMLKLKDKARKKRKNEDKFNQKVSESKDKVQEISQKSVKIDKISTDTEKEILRLRDKASQLVQKSKVNENEFVEIFNNIENIDTIPLSSEKKKSKKGTKKTEAAIVPKDDKNSLHWTEEERGKWNPSAKTAQNKVSDMLNAMKAMAVQGDTSILDSLKTSISHCQKLDEENKAEIEKIKIEKKKQEEDKKKKELENKMIEEKIKLEKEQSNRKKIENKSTKDRKEPKEAVKIPVKKISKEEQQRLDDEEEDRQILELERKLEQKKKDEKMLEEKLKTDFERQMMEDMKKMEDKRKIEADREKQREEMARVKEEEEKRKREQLLKIQQDENERQMRRKQLEEEHRIREEQEAEKKRIEEEQERKRIEEKREKQKQEKKRLKEEEERKKEEARLKRKEEAERLAQIEQEKKRKQQELEDKRKEEIKKKKQLEEEKRLKQLEAERQKIEEESRKLEEDLIRRKKEADEQVRLDQEQKEREEKKLKLKKEKELQEESRRKAEEKLIKEKEQSEQEEKRKILKEKQMEEELNERNRANEERLKLEREKFESQMLNDKLEKEKQLQKEIEEKERLEILRRNEEEEDKRIAELEERLEFKRKEESLIAARERENHERKQMDKNKPMIDKESGSEKVKENQPNGHVKPKESLTKPPIETPKPKYSTTKPPKESPKPIHNVAKPPESPKPKHSITITPNDSPKTLHNAAKPPESPKPKHNTTLSPKESPKPKHIARKPRNESPGSVVVVDTNSFVPKKNKKDESHLIRTRSPSLTRKAVRMEVTIEENKVPEASVIEHSNKDNYKITKIPTTVFEIKKPQARPEKDKKIPTSGIVLEQVAKTYAANVAKYSETLPSDRSRKRSSSQPRPPPPSFKPPPPPPIF